MFIGPPEAMQDLDLDSLCIVARDNSVGSGSEEIPKVLGLCETLMGGTWYLVSTYC